MIVCLSRCYELVVLFASKFRRLQNAKRLQQQCVKFLNAFETNRTNIMLPILYLKVVPISPICNVRVYYANIAE